MKAYEVLKKAEETVAGLLLVATVVILLTLATSRIIGSPVSGLLTLAMVTLTWAVFIGVDVAYREGGMVAIDFAVLKLPPRWRKLAQFATYVLIAGFLALIVILGVRLMMHDSGRVLPGSPLPYSVVSIALPVSSALLHLTTGTKFIALARRKSPDDGDASDQHSQVL